MSIGTIYLFYVLLMTVYSIRNTKNPVRNILRSVFLPVISFSRVTDEKNLTQEALKRRNKTVNQADYEKNTPVSSRELAKAQRNYEKAYNKFAQTRNELVHCMELNEKGKETLEKLRASGKLAITFNRLRQDEGELISTLESLQNRIGQLSQELSEKETAMHDMRNKFITVKATMDIQEGKDPLAKTGQEKESPQVSRPELRTDAAKAFAEVITITEKVKVPNPDFVKPGPEMDEDEKDAYYAAHPPKIEKEQITRTIVVLPESLEENTANRLRENLLNQNPDIEFLTRRGDINPGDYLYQESTTDGTTRRASLTELDTKNGVLLNADESVRTLVTELSEKINGAIKENGKKNPNIRTLTVNTNDYCTTVAIRQGKDTLCSMALDETGKILGTAVGYNAAVTYAKMQGHDFSRLEKAKDIQEWFSAANDICNDTKQTLEKDRETKLNSYKQERTSVKKKEKTRSDQGRERD